MCGMPDFRMQTAWFGHWIPAFAGMTVDGWPEVKTRLPCVGPVFSTCVGIKSRVSGNLPSFWRKPESRLAPCHRMICLQKPLDSGFRRNDGH